jgi:outer membrane immunogenic protein
MKKTLFAVIATVALGAALPAAAADLGPRGYRAPPPPPVYAPIYNWTGFYLGGHLGGAFGGGNNFGGLALASNNDARFLGGVQVGADWQFAGNWVIGAEGQYSWLSKNNAVALFPGPFAYNNDQGGLGSVTARLGYSFGPALVYVKGGYAYSNNRETLIAGLTSVPFLLSNDHTNGWTIGGGVEYMFAPNWSAKAEYQYYDFGNSHFVLPVQLAPFGSFQNDVHTFKVGVNYRFNFAGPVAAPY